MSPFWFILPFAVAVVIRGGLWLSDWMAARHSPYFRHRDWIVEGVRNGKPLTYIAEDGDDAKREARYMAGSGYSRVKVTFK